MKKPLILLVDDDPSVLEALEAELTPALSEICRIEVFSGGAEVLEALDEWTREERSIAVAIVDQKMPGMTGVELLTELRRRAREGGGEGAGPHPAAFLRAILLTGYAGLDSAVEAKNSGEVERYLEKPWGGGSVVSVATKALDRFARDSGCGTHFVFRELRDLDEVREQLALRYRIYRGADHVSAFVAPGSLALDVDAYDQRSRFFGLYRHGGERPTLVGCLRVVGQDATSLGTEVPAIAASDDELVSRARGVPGYPLPLLEYAPERDVILALVEELLERGERVVEPSRLGLLPEARSGAGAQMRLAAQMIEGSVAFFFFLLQVENAMLGCITPHRVFYRPFGFRTARGTHPQRWPVVEIDAVCLHGSQRTVPARAQERMSPQVERLRLTGVVCRCRTYPACLPGSYGTGDFGAEDLFCPMRASELRNVDPV